MASKCGVAKVYESMSDEDRKALRALLSAPIHIASAAAVSRELATANYEVSYQTITRHRAGTCSCEVL